MSIRRCDTSKPKNVELKVIVLDDGSADGTAKIVHAIARIAPATLVLVGGRVLPPCVLWVASLQTHPPQIAIVFSMLGTIAAFLPRPLAVRRFQQPLGGALLHPLGVCALIAIQWAAFFRSFCRQPTVWKGRAYSTVQSAP
jgi:hypothetical protein